MNYISNTSREKVPSETCSSAKNKVIRQKLEAWVNGQIGIQSDALNTFQPHPHTLSRRKKRGLWPQRTRRSLVKRLLHWSNAKVEDHEVQFKIVSHNALVQNKENEKPKSFST